MSRTLALRTIAITTAFAAIQVALILAGPSSVPLPTGLNVTILAIPTILAGVLAGVLGGGVVGLVFGVTSLAVSTTPLFRDPVVALVPRILVGIVAALVFRYSRSINEVVALALAGATGALVNTGVVLAFAAVLIGPTGAPYLPPDAASDVARANIPSEALLAMLLTIAGGLAARAARLLLKR
ncbi:MAG TPA: ECF transporter S component [Candidatus Limnocylindria bacterium]